MAIPWPSERVFRMGLVEFLAAALSLVVGVGSLRRGGLIYMSPLPSTRVLFAVGFLGLIAFGFLLFRLVRRREYPWILGLAAVALPLFQPSQTPFNGLTDRIVLSIRDLALLGVAFYFLLRTMKTTDEMEQRIHLRALAWSYGLTLFVLIGYAVAEDVLPPLRGTWVASGMLGSWVVAWLATSIRYQR